MREDGFPRGGFRKELTEPQPFQVYPTSREFDPWEHCGEERVTVVTPTGGVAHSGIPAYVGLDGVIYAGGLQREFG